MARRDRCPPRTLARLALPALAALALLAVGGPPAPTAAGPSSLPEYGPMIDLGTLGGSSSSAHAVSDNGIVVGVSNVAGDGPGHGFAFDPSVGVMVDLGTLGGDRSIAQGVNDAGIVVGSSRLAGNLEEHAFSYDLATGVMTDLGTPGETSTANAIADDGRIVGAQEFADGLHAATYDPATGVWTELEPVLDRSFAADINRSGQVVGQAGVITFPFPDTAVSWAPGSGQATDLGTLGAPKAAAEGINDDGVIVGHSAVAGFDQIARPFVIRSSHGVMEELDIGYPRSATAQDINPDGLVVGSTETEAGERLAYVHDLADDTTIELGALATGRVSVANAINTSGTVVGASTTGPNGGPSHAFMVQPLDLPSPPAPTSGVDPCAADPGLPACRVASTAPATVARPRTADPSFTG